jgi:hypothetical protein
LKSAHGLPLRKTLRRRLHRRPRSRSALPGVPEIVAASRQSGNGRKIWNHSVALKNRYYKLFGKGLPKAIVLTRVERLPESLKPLKYSVTLFPTSKSHFRVTRLFNLSKRQRQDYLRALILG